MYLFRLTQICNYFGWSKYVFISVDPNMYLFRLTQICLAINAWTQLSAPEKFDVRTELKKFINTGGGGGVQF